MPIRILSDQLASQIAAGEVVERPASAVKELVENALDANARTINVEIRNGGRDLIQVADDGTGIAAEEVERAFQRHATSKLQSAADLEAIASLGFRGEALAAIAAVSQVTIVTRTASAPAGVRLSLDGGVKKSRDMVGAPQGTVIAVENLFYNVPARRKFLKSVTTEKRLIDEFVTRYALAYPHVRFRLIHDGRVTFQTSGSGRLPDVLVAVYGVDIARELLSVGSVGDEDLEIEGPEELGATSHRVDRRTPIAVNGFVGPPSLHRANRSQITLFVNKRWIKDNHLTYAVIQAYHTMLPTGRYPVAIIFVEAPYDHVDVNVHPAKTEVRFRDSNLIFSAVQRAIRQSLVANSPVRSATLGATGRKADSYAGWGGSLDELAFARHTLPDAQQNLHFAWPEESVPPLEVAPTDVLRPAPGNGERLPIMRVVGQVGAAYIIAEGPDGIFLIDQHAAHERILYEQFMAARDSDRIASQGLVNGATVQLAPDQATLLEVHLDLLTELGFRVEPFGPNTFMVRAIPALLSKLDPAAALAAVVEDLETGNEPLQDRVEAKVILRVCKTAAVKAGQSLSPSEMQAMIEQLEACQNPHTCPHGRPTLIHLSAAQLAKQFGRT